MSPARLGFLLLPRYSPVSLAGPLEAFAQAGETGERPLYECVLLTADGRTVPDAAGHRLEGVVPMHAAPPLEAIFVVAATPLPQQGHAGEVAWLARHSPGPTLAVGGLGTGAWLLARAGLLEGCRATLHWPYAALFAESFPNVVVSSRLYESDRHRHTCGGGAASLDLAIALIAERHGEDLAAELVDHFGLERRRGREEDQRVPLTARIGGGQPKLTEAVSLMEANYEEPLPTEEIARLVGVSRRQLERLFKQYLDTLPSRYYLELRLNRARRLLQQTSQSILQIGLACGFSSGPHFSSAYRNHFGITPREQRSQRAGSGGAPLASPGDE
jgi:transcriptional regulator GlxA family with amidase domain